MTDLKLNFDFAKITQNKNFGTVVFALIISLFLVDIVFVLIPEIKVVGAVIKKSKDLAQKLNLGKRESQNIEVLKEQAQEKKSKLEFTEKYFTSEEELGLVIEEVFKFANEAGVKINQVKPVKDAASSRQEIQQGQEAAFIKIPILVIAEAGYHSLGAFIDKIEKAQRFLSINELKLVGNASDYLRSGISMNIAAVLKSSQ